MTKAKRATGAENEGEIDSQAAYQIERLRCARNLARRFGVQMFVCNCNGVRQRDMSAAVDHVAACGAPTVDAVYAQCGVTPKCGRCKVDIQRMLDAAMRPALAMAAE